MDEERRPAVAYAMFCERVERDAEGSLRFLRPVQRWTHRDVGPFRPFTLEFPLALGLTFDVPGTHLVDLVAVSPSGDRSGSDRQAPIVFDPGKLNSELTGEYSMGVRELGLYWVEVRVDGALVTRIPLEVRYEEDPPGVDLPTGKWWKPSSTMN